ncbi:hypothetical protein ACSXCJ_12325 [Clostridium perfringens]|uniref:hypothetical protein n=1 Tax=Clostridium perfringens TaxID=1502 RepID=UPI001ABA7ADB|nr:hypothetical protein [Clostridium perfringens]EIF2086700.1 hypothetical protein [Clostridium perfringens]MBO3395102.1 hypothetical protein [Clostridium perfringens]MBO3400916.1 hypothetical protein [Clostridium perfringens]
MKILFKLLKNVIIALIILTIAIFFAFDLSFMTTHNFDMITLNTVLVGFLFTIYTLLVSLLDEKAVKTYEKTNDLSKIHNKIVLGILLGVLTCLLSILILCLYGEPNGPLKTFNKILYAFDLASFLIVLWSIVGAIIDMASIVGAVRDNKINKTNKDVANEDMKNRFSNDKKD